MKHINTAGFTHVLALVLVVSLIGAAGILLQRSSHADSNSEFNNSAARAAARVSHGSVGYAVYDSAGHRVAGYHDRNLNYGASITKSMILVAYLNQLGSKPMSNEVNNDLTRMIQYSDNAAANRMYSRLNNGPEAIKRVAKQARMKSFRFDDGDVAYRLGQSQISANDFARFFARIDKRITYKAERRSFAMRLLSNVTPHAGLLNAGLPGTIYSKEGWKPQPDKTNPFGNQGAPFVVNQAAQFSKNGKTYGIAVTVSGARDQGDGEQTVQRLVSALVK